MKKNGALRIAIQSGETHLSSLGILVLFLFLLLLLPSCSSLSTWVRSNLEGVPVWVYEPQISRNQTAFVGQGTAENETRARVLSYESVLLQLSSYIGRDVTGQHIAELSSRDAIDAFRLRVTQEFVKNDSGRITVYFLAVADNSVLEQARTEAEVQLVQQVQQMNRLNGEAAQAIRNNQDTVAANLYIRIAVIASSLPVDRGEKQFSDAIDQLRTILRRLTISVSQGNPAIPTTQVIVRRGTHALSPRVAGAQVAAYSEARDGLGSSYRDKQRFVTDTSGQFLYTSNNPTLAKSGTLEFMVDFEKELEPLRTVDADIYDEMVELLKNKVVTYPYERVSLMANQKLVIVISEYSMQGELLVSTAAGASLAAELEKDGIVFDIAQMPSIDTDDDLIAALQQRFPNYTAIMYGNVGISHMNSTQSGEVITVTGETLVCNLTRGTVVGRTGSVKAHAVAETVEEARSKAFSQFGAITASLLGRYLYR